MVYILISSIEISCPLYLSKILTQILLTLRPLGIEWEHEDASVMLLDYLIDENHIDIERHDTRFV